MARNIFLSNAGKWVLRKESLRIYGWMFMLRLFFLLFGFGFRLLAQGELKEQDLPSDQNSLPQVEQTDTKEKSADDHPKSPNGIRRFHEVLDNLLSDFGDDLKKGELKSINNLAIRRVDVNEILPYSYQKYIKVLMTEKFQENTQIRMIQCLTCESKTSKLVEGKIMITSPMTNAAQLKSVAEVLGIRYFMDVMLVYHSSHMVLAVQIFQTENNELIWSRSYNSESLRSKYQNKAVDFRQIAKPKPGEDYLPEYRFLFGPLVASMPNIGDQEKTTTMVGVELRGAERFNNRKSEFGLLLSVYANFSSFLTNYPTAAQNTETTQDTTTPVQDVTGLEPYQYAATVGAFYSYNFLGEVESYDDIRFGIHSGVGSFLAPGYIAGFGRLGLDTFYGRRFHTGVAGIYIFPSKVLVGSDFQSTNGGIGFELVASYNL